MRPDQVSHLESSILARRVCGESAADIAIALQVPVATVLTVVVKLMNAAREEAVGMATELFTLQNMRLEALYAKLHKHLHDSADGTFDDKLVRAIISVFERQAKLNGLDKAMKARPGGGGIEDWLDTATPKEVLEYAEQLGCITPNHVLPE